MSGICGYISNNHFDKTVIQEMVSILNHRGPDSQGLYINETLDGKQIALGHARLAVIDLSQDGHQPMHYEHLSIVLNGAIYNYIEIKEELNKLGHHFETASDTEVILHAFEEWGLNCVEHFIGMFVFVIFDKKANKLLCCRDRAGVKPFFYFLNNNYFLFASELKALMKHPQFKKDLDLNTVSLYFKFGYIPSPYCIFKGVNKLLPGTWLIFDIEKDKIIEKEYWSIIDAYSQPKLRISYQEAKDELVSVFRSAFSFRMIADVPVGVFLSGGYDSTLVTSILQSMVGSKIKTFTIGFFQGNNEAQYAEKISQYLGTEHTEQYCTEKEALEIIPELPFYFDEPFADSSSIPTILVSRLARKEVAVALSADAGDELFVGYNRYISLYKYLKHLSLIPLSIRSLFGKSLIYCNYFLPKKCYFLRHEISVLSQVLKEKKEEEAIRLLAGIESFSDEFIQELLLFKPKEFNYLNEKRLSAITGFDSALAFDFFMYMQNDILTKVDRATMSISLEGREPLLDHRITEFVARLPLEYKFDGFSTKKILKDVVYDYIPKPLMDRTKRGFSAPIVNWLKNDLKFLLYDVLNEKKIASQGIMDPLYIKSLLEEFSTNNSYYQNYIWSILQFQMWYDKWM